MWTERTKLAAFWDFGIWFNWTSVNFFLIIDPTQLLSYFWLKINYAQTVTWCPKISFQLTMSLNFNFLQKIITGRVGWQGDWNVLPYGKKVTNCHARVQDISKWTPKVSNLKVYFRSIRDLDLELVAIIAMPPPRKLFWVE